LEVTLNTGKIDLNSKLIACSLLALAVAGCRTQDFPNYPADYREYAYVTNGGSGTVTVLDVVNVRVDRELPVGQNPVAVAASPTRNEVYVVNSGAAGGQGSLSVIDAEKNAVAATIPLHSQPASIDIDGEGKLAYVANTGSNSISVVDLNSRREVAQVGAGEEPVAARLSPDGKTLAVANRMGNSLSLIDPKGLTVRSVFAGCPGASDVVMLPDSSKAFVACSAGHQVMSVALAKASQPASAQTGSATPTAALSDRLETFMDVGRGPVQLALKPDGGEVFVVNSVSNSISEVITGTNDVQGASMMGDNPVSGLVSTDNALLYVGNLHSQNVIVYSIDDGKRVGYVHVGDGPSAMAFSARGHLLFVVDARSNDVAVIRTAALSDNITTGRTASLPMFTLMQTGRNPNAIVDKSFTVR
jgi:YVTN family beta-propeller protein